MSGPIFICGTGRCGTSWLHSILRHHSHIYALKWEGRIAVAPGGLFDVQRQLLSQPSLERFRYNMLGPWFKQVFRAGTPREYEAGLFADISYEDLETLVNTFEQQVRDGIEEAMRKLVSGVFSSGIAAQGGTRWQEKTPRNVVYLEELHRLYPDAKFLHIIRDGRDVAVSIMENFWPIGENPKEDVSFRELERDVRNAARYWKYFLEIGFKSAAKLPESACLALKYEDLIANTEKTLRDVCTFLGEPFEEQLLVFRPKGDRQGRWREVFTDKDKSAFKEEAQDMLVRLGYEQDDKW